MYRKILSGILVASLVLQGTSSYVATVQAVETTGDVVTVATESGAESAEEVEQVTVGADIEEEAAGTYSVSTSDYVTYGEDGFPTHFYNQATDSMEAINEGEWIALKGTESGQVGVGNYYLTQDTVMEGSSFIQFNGGSLFLNGYTLSTERTGSAGLIIANTGGTEINIFAGTSETTRYGYMNDDYDYIISETIPSGIENYDTINHGLITNGKRSGAGSAVSFNNSTEGSRGMLRVFDLNISGNHAASGGAAIYLGNYNGLEIYNATITNNTTGIVLSSTYADGGAVYTGTYTDIHVVDSTISYNQVKNYGGGMYVLGSSSLRVTDSQFYGNSASEGGGIYMAAAATMNIENSDFYYNKATYSGLGSGGAINVRNIGSVVNISDSNFEYNEANGAGGAIHGYGYQPEEEVYEVDMTVKNCVISNNTSHNTAANWHATGGGGIHMIVNSRLTVEDTVLENNKSAAGGAICLYLGGELHTNNVEIKNNTVEDATNLLGGGGIYITSGSLYWAKFDINNTTITNNTSSSSGGGFVTRGLDTTGTIRNSEISDNTTTYIGGGIYAENGDFEIINSEINRNSALVAGGMMVGLNTWNIANNKATMSIDGTTVSENISTGSAGGILINGSEFTMKGNSEISYNVAQGAFNTGSNDNKTNTGYGGGILIKGGYVENVVDEDAGLDDDGNEIYKEVAVQAENFLISGKIVGNESNSGAGVANFGGITHMEEGMSIYENHANYVGGGVVNGYDEELHLPGIFYHEGGEVRENTADYSGAGVSILGEITNSVIQTSEYYLRGGTITENQTLSAAESSGDSVYIREYGRFIFESGALDIDTVSTQGYEVLATNGYEVAGDKSEMILLANLNEEFVQIEDVTYLGRNVTEPDMTITQLYETGDIIKRNLVYNDDDTFEFTLQFKDELLDYEVILEGDEIVVGTHNSQFLHTDGQNTFEVPFKITKAGFEGTVETTTQAWPGKTSKINIGNLRDDVIDQYTSITYGNAAYNKDEFDEVVVSGSGTLTYTLSENTKVGDSYEIQIQASSNNFVDTTILVTVIVVEEGVLYVESINSLVKTYDATAFTIKDIESTVKYDGEEVYGEWSFKEDVQYIDVVDTMATVVFTPVETDLYSNVELEIPVKISPRTVMVMAQNVTIDQGDELTLVAVGTGFQGNDTFLELPTVTTVSAYSAKGQYPINVTGGKASDNYELHYLSGILTIASGDTDLSGNYSQGGTTSTDTSGTTDGSFDSVSSADTSDNTNVFVYVMLLAGTAIYFYKRREKNLI